MRMTSLLSLLLVALSIFAVRDADALRADTPLARSSSSSTYRVGVGRQGVISSSSSRLNLTLEQYLQELSSSGIGRIRFVVIGSGSILEAVGSFSNLRFSQTARGRLATISTDEPCFECHFKMDTIASVKHAVVDKFGKLLRVIRFSGAGDDKDTTYLSAILHESSGPEAEVFNGLRARYGDSLVFETIS